MTIINLLNWQSKVTEKKALDQIRKKNPLEPPTPPLREKCVSRMHNASFLAKELVQIGL